MRILVVKPSSLGDVVHTIPAVSLLHQCLPDCRLSWVVNDGLADILGYCQAVDRIIRFPRKARKAGAFLAFWRELRAEKYDFCIDYQGLLRSGLMAWLSGAGRRYGFASAREGAPWFYTRPLAFPQDIRHAVEKNLWLTGQVLRAETGIEAPAQPRRIDFSLPADEMTAAATQLPPGEGPVLAIGFSSSWPSKNWSPEFFREVIFRTAGRCPGLRCWLLGSPAEREAGEKLLQRLQGLQAVNLAGRTTLRSLCCLLRQTGAVLTNDSGPMHIAAVLGTPCVALFGATDPVLTGPYGIGGLEHRVFRSKCPESPCFRRECCLSGVSCSDGVSADEVAGALAGYLQSKKIG